MGQRWIVCLFLGFLPFTLLTLLGMAQPRPGTGGRGEEEEAVRGVQSWWCHKVFPKGYSCHLVLCSQVAGPLSHGVLILRVLEASSGNIYPVVDHFQVPSPLCTDSTRHSICPCRWASEGRTFTRCPRSPSQMSSWPFALWKCRLQSSVLFSVSHWNSPGLLEPLGLFQEMVGEQFYRETCKAQQAHFLEWLLLGLSAEKLSHAQGTL